MSRIHMAAAGHAEGSASGASGVMVHAIPDRACRPGPLVHLTLEVGRVPARAETHQGDSSRFEPTHRGRISLQGASSTATMPALPAQGDEPQAGEDEVLGATHGSDARSRRPAGNPSGTICGRPTRPSGAVAVRRERPPAPPTRSRAASPRTT